MSIDPTRPAPAPLTADQQAALSKLHETAQQMESLFVNMLFAEMRKTAPQGGGLTGKPSAAEQTFGEMLDEKRAEELSKSGSLGLAKMIEQQLRSAVVGDTAAAPPAQEGQKS